MHIRFIQLARLVSPFLAVAIAPSLRAAQMPLWEVEGQIRRHTFGGEIAPTGDWDRDGVNDVIVAGGFLYLLSGRTGEILHTIVKPVWTADCVMDLGDLDGDAYPDFGASGVLWRLPLGHIDFVKIYSGRSMSGFLTIYDPLGWSLVAGDDFGSFFCAIGDISGDGISDMLVRAELNPANPGGGGAYVISGSDGAVLRTHAPFTSSTAEEFGHGLSPCADYDGDGTPEYAIGAPEKALWSPIYPGRVGIFHGRTGALLADIPGPMIGSLFGDSIARAGDVDGDGLLDLLIGAPLDDTAYLDAGSLHVLSGRTLNVIRIISGDREDRRLGVEVYPAVDFDGDGLPEQLALSPGPNGDGAMALNVFAGADSALLYRLEGEPDSHFGLSASSEGHGPVCSPGDLDGDGLPDLVVGAPFEESGRPRTGVVRAFTGWSDVPILELSDYVEGQTMTAQLDNLLPGSTAWVGWSATGAGPTPTPIGPALLSPPIQVSPPLVASPNGRVVLHVNLPAGSAGQVRWAQAYGTTASGKLALGNGWMMVVQA